MLHRFRALSDLTFRVDLSLSVDWFTSNAYSTDADVYAVMLTVGRMLAVALAIAIASMESYGAEMSSNGKLSRNEFVVEKDQRLPHSQLIVQLPIAHTTFDHFIAKVVDISPSIDSSIRDTNRTFLASTDDSRTIRVHSLHPGHKYRVSIIGRKDDTSSILREDEITMDPLAPQFPIQDIDITMNNITLKVVKNEKYVQDSFLVEYRQLEPDKHYPLLEVHDIPEQKNLEIT
ncbi:hypothetical protein KIN20_018156 [Parelaphostrongylus tenuis]|uniref:Uncharacterized protein n=1 Tax=Parelaphostrongylus tenuis TaxID=148309 RepID=A0AAD5N3B1_PARTN|nr:hypothetical protein KIN20_018156 [Parelaphostrongylus tenuis]